MNTLSQESSLSQFLTDAFSQGLSMLLFSDISWILMDPLVPSTELLKSYNAHTTEIQDFLSDKKNTSDSLCHYLGAEVNVEVLKEFGVLVEKVF